MMQAYKDVTPLLGWLAGPQWQVPLIELCCFLSGMLGKAPSDLVIYDPYYCAGSSPHDLLGTALLMLLPPGGIVRRLGNLGFHTVINRNEGNSV